MRKLSGGPSFKPGRKKGFFFCATKPVFFDFCICIFFPPTHPPIPRNAILQEEVSSEDDEIELTPEQKAAIKERKKKIRKAWKKLQRRMTMLNLLRLRRAASPVPSMQVTRLSLLP